MNFGGFFWSRRSAVSLCVAMILTCGLAAIGRGTAESLAEDTYHEIVRTPFPDGIRREIPTELGNRKLADLGFVDVTAAPFHADPTGKSDATRAIQRAVIFARNHQMVCYFPRGRYRVSDTIHCTQIPAKRTSGALGPGDQFPCVLMGEYGGIRPQLMLAPRSYGFDDTETPKYVIHFRALAPNRSEEPRPNISMNQMLVNLDVAIGEENPGAVGIRHRAAQGSAIQECTVDATHGRTGIEGGIGSGGSIADVTVIGGDVGLDLRETQPAPTLTAVTLIRQRESAIVYAGRQALCGVGVKIVSAGPHPAIQGLPAGYMAPRGQICLVDSEIVFEAPVRVAIQADRSIFLENVFIQGAEVAVADGRANVLAGRGAGWLLIRTFARGVRPRKWRGYAYEAPIWLDGRRTDAVLSETAPGRMPPPDLQSRHRWRISYPGVIDKEVFNVRSGVAPFGAVGDGVTDDGPAIQRAIEAHRTVLLPKGYYRITAPLQLRADTRLIGAGRHLSVIVGMGNEGAFSDPENHLPLVQTADARDASTLIAFCGLHVPDTVSGAYALNWRCGGRSVLRDVNMITRPLGGYKRPGKAAERNHPLVRVTGNGGGQWYNFFHESHRGQKVDYRHLSIEGVGGPLAVYACNPEHALGAANMEIVQSAYVSIYGLKSEGNRTVLRVKDSNHISVFGYGGNAAALPGESLFVFRGTTDFMVANMVDTPRLPPARSPNPGFGKGVDPTKWWMIRDEPVSGPAINTRPMDRPVLYRRGHPNRFPDDAAGAKSIPAPKTNNG